MSNEEKVGVTLTKNSELVETYYEYDETLKKGLYKQKIIDTFPSANILHDMDFYLEEGITLKEVLLYLSKDIELWDFLIGNWCKDLVTEGLKGKEIEETSLEYLELYWGFEIEKYETNEAPQVSAGKKMELHAKGKKDSYGADTYSLLFSKINNIVNLPLKIKKDVTLDTTDYSSSPVNFKVTYLGDCTPSLFQVIYGIFWELSFYGSSESKENKRKELEGIVEEIKDKLNKEKL